MPQHPVNSAARRWVEAGAQHIDVRGLEPPAPLVAILQLLDSVDAACELIVHHDRDPLLLYPELAERGWSAENLDAPPGEVRLRLARTNETQRTPT
jgi:Uncharacterized conserved protein (DUF2249)